MNQFATEEPKLALQTNAENTLEKQQVIESSGPSGVLDVLFRLASNPGLNIENLKELLAMQREVMADQRKAAYFAAMSRVQAKVPHVKKDGRIVVKGVERSRFSRLEDIDVAVRHLLADEGLAISYDTESSDGKLFRCFGRMSHCDGHFEIKQITLPLDVSDYRSPVQSAKSTWSYSRRILIEMFLNLIEDDADDDGSGGKEYITQDQADTLRSTLETVANLNMVKFLEFMQVEKLEEILKENLPSAYRAIETAKRKGR